MKYHYQEFKVMKADQIENWVRLVSTEFGNKYMFNFYGEPICD